MNSTDKGKGSYYNLEARTLKFAADCIQYVQVIPKSLPNIEISKQLIRSSGSIGANYIEANEALGKKDFIMHVKISKKEAKETCYWLKLTQPGSNLSKNRDDLVRESDELTRILGAIWLRYIENNPELGPFVKNQISTPKE